MRLVQTTTSDGLYLNGIVNDCGNKDLAIIHIHGLQEDFYSHTKKFLEEYDRHGIFFISSENRGSHVATNFQTIDGGNRLIGSAYERFEECVYDIDAWVTFAAALGYTSIWLQARSLGAAKAAYYLNIKKDSRVHGLILLSPSDTVGLVKDPIGKADHDILYPEALSLTQAQKGSQLLSHMLWGDVVLSADTYLNVFSDGSSANIFHYYDVSLPWNAVNSISIPVLAVTSMQDDGVYPVLSPPEAMNILKEHMIHVPNIQTIIFEEADHSFSSFEEKIVEEVVSFIAS